MKTKITPGQAAAFVATMLADNVANARPTTTPKLPPPGRPQSELVVGAPTANKGDVFRADTFQLAQAGNSDASAGAGVAEQATALLHDLTTYEQQLANNSNVDNAKVLEMLKRATSLTSNREASSEALADVYAAAARVSDLLLRTFNTGTGKQEWKGAVSAVEQLARDMDSLIKERGGGMAPKVINTLHTALITTWNGIMQAAQRFGDDTATTSYAGAILSHSDAAGLLKDPMANPALIVPFARASLRIQEALPELTRRERRAAAKSGNVPLSPFDPKKTARLQELAADTMRALGKGAAKDPSAIVTNFYLSLHPAAQERFLDAVYEVANVGKKPASRKDPQLVQELRPFKGTVGNGSIFSPPPK